MSFIYLTTNLVTNKIYIGQSTINKKGYLGSGKILKKSIKKHGKQNFKRDVLIEGNINQVDLNNLEKYYISLYDSRNIKKGYNIAEGGGGCNFIGKGDAISKAKKGKFIGWGNSQSYPILQIDKHNNVIKLWSSAYQAQIESNYLSTHILGVCKNTTKHFTYKDFIWRFASNTDIETYSHLKDIVIPKVEKSQKNLLITEVTLDGKEVKEWCNKDLRKYLNLTYFGLRSVINRGTIKNGSKFIIRKNNV